MFLHRLSIRDFRSIPAADIDFTGPAGDTRRWTIVLGENGAGKSSLLRAAGLVLAGSDALAALLGEPDRWIRLGAPEAVIQAELVTAEGEKRSLSLTIRRGDGAADVVRRCSEGLAPLDAALKYANRNYFVVGYGASRRAGTGRSSHGESRYEARAAALSSLFDADAPLTSLEQWAADLHYQHGEEGLEAVRETLDALLPEVQFVGIDRSRKQLQFQTADGVVPFTALSDGYQAAATWAGDLLHRVTSTFADWKRPRTARGLLLIDEVELHLHPTWQRRLLGFVSATFPNLQVFTTTHAPMTAHQAGDRELYVLRRHAEGPRLHAFPGAPNRLVLPELLASPLFGVETLDSAPVQDLRLEYAALRDDMGEVASQRRREIRQSLPPLTWGSDSPALTSIARTIEEVKKLLPVKGVEDVP